MAAIARLRLRLSELDAEAHRGTPQCPANLRRSQGTDARAELQELIERGTPDVSRMVEIGAGIDWPQVTERMAIISTATDQYGYATGERIDAHALFAFLFSKQLTAALDVQIDAVADDRAALDDKTRKQKLVEIAVEKLAVERAECSAIEAAALDGIAVDYREGCDVRAALCC